MVKWEYRVEHLAHRGDKKYAELKDGKMYWQIDLEKALNALGADGWDLVYFPGDLLDGGVDGFALFKRKIKTPDPE